MHSVSSLNNDFIKPLNTVKSQASFFKTIHDLHGAYFTNLFFAWPGEGYKSNGNQAIVGYPGSSRPSNLFVSQKLVPMTEMNGLGANRRRFKMANGFPAFLESWALNILCILNVKGARWMEHH
jgi:hypothetical protein